MRSSRLLLAACLSVAVCQAGGRDDVLRVESLPASASTSLAPDWSGFNLGAHASEVGPWGDSSFRAAIASLAPSSLRYPAGTFANYWDWKCGGEQPCTGGTSTLEDFLPVVRATHTRVIFVLNMLTDTLTSQLAFLAHATSLGFDVRYVECGNEFYNNEPDYVKKFPSGADYGRTAAQWIAAVRAVYPSAAVSVVGVPSYRSGHNARLTGWNAGLFDALKNTHIDGVSMHEYDATGVSGKSFSARDVPLMLATPFAVKERIATAASTLPANVGVWVTEYNLLYNTGKPDVPAFGTWAHGLFVVLEAVLFLDVDAIARGRVTKHCLFGYADDGALFENTAAFDFAMSPDTTLPTPLFGRSSHGLALTLLNNATAGMTSTAAMSFAPNPVINPGGGAAPYPTLVGRSFGTSSAIVLNLGGVDVQWNVPAGSFSRFEQLSAADASVAVNNERVITSHTGGVGAGVAITLPAFSITRLH